MSRQHESSYKPSDDKNEQLWANCYQQNPLLQQQPVLFMLVMHYAEHDHWSDEQRLSSCKLTSVVDLLGLIELPATDRVLAALAKATEVSSRFLPLSYAPSELDKLYRFFQSEALNHVAEQAIPADVEQLMDFAKLLVEFPALAKARFIQRHSQKHCLSWAQLKIQRIKWAANSLQISDIDKKLRRCRHHKDVCLLKQRLENQLSDSMVTALATVDLNNLDDVLDAVLPWLNPLELSQLEAHWFDRYDPAPIADNEHFIQLSDYQALFLESHRQHNCAETYRCDVQIGDYAIFKVLQPERATLGLRWHPQQQRFVLDELVAKNNQTVSASTRRAVKRWLKRAQATTVVANHGERP
ncbi:hypothetical protein A1353_08400 [Methylomonas methanica]|uniref:PcfJ-like protein n=1 Tax=Methylomonas methanica TaxID=421 RepID=A0A177MNY8_METMH|nr:hypothetical protein [Methylomonas methanica]OAI07033.1 hypothetical protein A1353_08400 [Methylomonas methanica]